MTEVVTLGKDDAPKVDHPNRIVINFPNDHDIGGMKVEVIDVTPEQIAVALFHLTRTANQTADMRQVQASMSESEIREMTRRINRDRNGGGLVRGR